MKDGNIIGGFPISAVPKPIQVKYASQALIPSDITDGNHISQKYKLTGGEVVTLRWLTTWNNTNGKSDAELDKLCRELYDMDFESVKGVWQRRLGGRLENWWHKVEMNLSE